MSSTSAATRASLITRARQKDDQAWRELVALYSPLIVSWCARLGITGEATADCIQEVFASVARSLDTFHTSGSAGAFRGWLWVITRNKLRDAARRRARGPEARGGSTMLGILHAVPDESDGVSITFGADASDLDRDAEPSSTEDVRQLMHRAMAQIERAFDAMTWRAFWRTVVDGVDTASVAAETGLSPASVRQAKSRILRRLRQQLGDME
ncbi:MAG: sigma-70 family RNA polymerase sigma factor [Pirellulales bacterium]